ncbi:putative cytochrome c1 heme lyase [Colletotrichum trifolii]|uniref:Holocytochrome c-type synthase n=1 Tax=Colletotrichum trifolii TaxID=5466 RepID=A0A4R8RRL1_COLTR|nr:putative cytochrome c1 heme lyase [Colletotrichum trifolii]
MATDLIDPILLTPPAHDDLAMSDQDKCPVDHKAREAWLQHARAANPDQPPTNTPSAPQITPEPPAKSWTSTLFSPFTSSSPSSSAPQTLPGPPHPQPSPQSADACPVDHNSREAWLQQARANTPPHPEPQPQPQTPAQPRPSTSTSWTSSLKSYLPFSSSSSTPAPDPQTQPSSKPASPLDTNRQVSTIPRTITSSYPYPPPTSPSNHEVETGADETTGNWIYPSEKMFFDAMKRKGHDTRVADMRTVVPIHNAVNERAWKEIKEWERPYTEGTPCDGPKLHSFAGLSTNMSPKARINTLLGYTPPFDRHDWVIDRCGVQVDYVIDFYAGRPDAHGKPSFYLDVRPKLNSWEGVKMRALRGVGLA